MARNYDEFSSTFRWRVRFYRGSCHVALTVILLIKEHLFVMKYFGFQIIDQIGRD